MKVKLVATIFILSSVLCLVFGFLLLAISNNGNPTATALTPLVITLIFTFVSVVNMITAVSLFFKKKFSWYLAITQEVAAIALGLFLIVFLGFDYTFILFIIIGFILLYLSFSKSFVVELTGNKTD